MSETQVITYRYRVKDKHSPMLNRMARSVNMVWNWANDTQKHALRWDRKWPTYFDLSYLTTGASKLSSIPSNTIDQVCKRYVTSRRQSKRPYLRYRGRKSLGWIPFRGFQIRTAEDGFRFNGKNYSVWLSRLLPDGKILDGGCFSQDAQGHWYINLPIEVSLSESKNVELIGIDLGLKDLCALSNGDIVEAPRIYRASEEKLSVARRAKKKRKVTKIHAKIKAQRRDFLHKVSADISSRFGCVAVGNVNPSGLAKTKMAKSVNDAGWADFKNMLAYKMRLRGGTFIEVNEAYTTQVCSSCGSLPMLRPKGIADLEIRQWKCDDCETVHDRDVNAAINIAHIARDMLAEGAAQ